jgi:anti-sigma B factor antagonist
MRRYGTRFPRLLVARQEFPLSFRAAQKVKSSRFIEQGANVNFSATIKESGQVSLVYITGSLTSFEVSGLRTTISSLLQQGRKKIILNLDGLRYLDSSGIGELVRNYMTVIKAGGEMKVVGLKPKVEEIFKVTQLHQSFPENRKKTSASSASDEKLPQKERSS